MFTIYKETDAAVLHDASTVEDQHQVVPLSFLCQLWTPEPHSVVAQSWVLFKLTSVTCTNGNGSGNTNPDSTDIIIIIYSLTARVVGAPQMISQPVFSIFPCSPLPSGTWWTPGLSTPWCCLPTSTSVCLVFFPPFTVSCKIVLARPDEWKTRPCHCSLCLFMMVRRSSYGLTTCWIWAQTDLTPNQVILSSKTSTSVTHLATVNLVTPPLVKANFGITNFGKTINSPNLI